MNERQLVAANSHADTSQSYCSCRFVPFKVSNFKQSALIGQNSFHFFSFCFFYLSFNKQNTEPTNPEFVFQIFNFWSRLSILMFSCVAGILCWPLNKFLVGLVVKVPILRAEDLGFKSCLYQDLSGSSHTSDLKIGNLVATLPGAWQGRVSAGTGWPSEISK